MERRTPVVFFFFWCSRTRDVFFSLAITRPEMKFTAASAGPSPPSYDHTVEVQGETFRQRQVLRPRGSGFEQRPSGKRDEIGRTSRDAAPRIRWDTLLFVLSFYFCHLTVQVSVRAVVSSPWRPGSRSHISTWRLSIESNLSKTFYTIRLRLTFYNLYIIRSYLTI